MESIFLVTLETRMHFFPHSVHYTFPLPNSSAVNILYSTLKTTFVTLRNGDVYAALRDVETSLSLNSTHRLSKQRRIQCLTELGLTEEACRFLDDYSYQHPHDTKFMERARKDLEEVTRKDGAGTSG